MTIETKQEINKLRTQKQSSQNKTTNNKKHQKQKKVYYLRECLEILIFSIIFILLIKNFIFEARYIPTCSMEPNLQAGDRVIIEKITHFFGRPIKRGDILVFYPPQNKENAKDLIPKPLEIAGKILGLAFLYQDNALIKRVIAFPGEKVEIIRDQGVFINEKLLPEKNYIKEMPNYNLKVLADIGEHDRSGQFVKPYGDSNASIVVPANKLFVLGDNRNNSTDSHAWGFLDQNRVIGRASLVFWRQLCPPIFNLYEIESKLAKIK